MYIMTLYAVFGIGSSLAKSYDLDGLSGAILSEIAYLLTIVPVNVTAEDAGIAGFVLPMPKLGSAGLFVGIVTTMIAIEIYNFMDKKRDGKSQCLMQFHLQLQEVLNSYFQQLL